MKNLLISLVVLILLATACHVHDPEDDHLPASGVDVHAAHPANDYTVFSKNLELFIEIEELVVGEESHMHAHFTTLDGHYAPLSGAQVKVHVNLGNERIQQLEGKASTPGIYAFEITPVRAAVIDLVFIVDASGFKDTLELHHIHVKGKEPGGHQHAHAEPERGEVSFVKEEAWKSDFNVEEAKTGSFSEVINTSGEILAMPGEKQNIIAKSEGVILFTSRDLVQGSEVNKGEVLFIISGKGLSENNISVKYNEAKTQFHLSKSNFERTEKLYAEKVVSEKQFLQSKSNYITDSVQYYSLKETVSGSGMQINAPMTGHLHELNVSEGQFVEKGQLLATISTNRVLLLRADIPQQFYEQLKRITDANFRPAYSSKVYTIEELNGRILAKGESVAENDHYLPVFFEVQNDGSLLEGAFAEFYLKTEPTYGKLVIPAPALIEEQNNFYVYVQISGETYSKRYVKVEENDGRYAVISQGLKEGERIVSEGAMLVKTASISSAPTHGHQH